MPKDASPNLIKHTLAILKNDKKLFTFQAIGTLLTIPLLVVTIIQLGNIEVAALKNSASVTDHTYFIFFGILLLFLISLNLIILMSCAATITCSLKKLKGEPYTLMNGFAVIKTHFFKLYRFQLLSNTFGNYIRFCAYWTDNWKEKRLPKELLANQAWQIATYFVIPILLCENFTVYQSIAHSAQLIQKKWGVGNKPLVKNIVASKKITMLRIFALIPLIVGALLIKIKMALIIGAVITSISLLTINTVSSTIQIFLVSALYLFANDVNISADYDSLLLEKVFVEKQSS